MSWNEILVLFLKLYGILMFVVAATWVSRANAGKVSPHNISKVFFAVSFATFSLCLLPVPGIWKVFYITFACLFLITAISVRTDPTEATLEDLRAWMRVVIICLIVTYAFTLAMDYSNFKREFERLIIAVFTFVCTFYYPSIMRRLRGD